MFRHKPKAKYEPNGGRFLQKLTAKDLYQQQVVVSVKGSDSFDADDYFTAKFPNIFTNYIFEEMRVESPLYHHWESQPMKLWQTQLNFAVFCASSACGVSSNNLNYKKHSLVRAVYRFHVYYHIRRVLKKLQAVLPHEDNFNPGDNPYTEKEFYNLCHEYNIPNDPMRYRFEKFFGSYQTGGLDDYLNPDSMMRWTIQTGNGFTDIGLVRISESIRAYAYLILSSQASARANIVKTTANALTTQQIYLNNFENIVNRRVDLQADIKRYQDTLNYASSKVDYSVGEGLYMLPSDMNLRIKRGVVGYNNEILVSAGLTLGKNGEVNKPEKKHPKVKNRKVQPRIDPKVQPHIDSKVQPNIDHSKVQPHTDPKSQAITDYELQLHTPKVQSHTEQPQPHTQSHSDPKKITHEEEKIALILSLVAGFTVWRII